MYLCISPSLLPLPGSPPTPQNASCVSLLCLVTSWSFVEVPGKSPVPSSVSCRVGIICLNQTSTLRIIQLLKMETHSNQLQEKAEIWGQGVEPHGTEGYPGTEGLAAVTVTRKLSDRSHLVSNSCLHTPIVTSQKKEAPRPQVCMKSKAN